MDILRFYNPDDFSVVILALARNGYRAQSWAELDRSNNPIYLIKLLTGDEVNLPKENIDETGS